jgi:glucoamylase
MRQAFGHPGIEPRWTHGNKDGVGTAYSGDSRLWFTLWNGCVTEVYFPTIDRPQVRDLQYLVTDGQSFFHDEKKTLISETQRSSSHALSYRVTATDPRGRYRIVKEVIASPHLPCLLQRTHLEGDETLLPRLRLYALCAPHLQVGGWGNNAYVLEVAGRGILAAQKGGTWLALAASVPFSRLSCGFVGASDGWTDLAKDFRMDWEFDRAEDGNVALTGELALDGSAEFTTALALGHGLHHAVTVLFEALGIPFEEQRARYVEQWERPAGKIRPLGDASGDGGHLYHGSHSLLLAHEDKSFHGAFIASLSIPWGETRGDEDTGGYHLVWTRDMTHTATALLAAGDRETPLRALIYLTATQGDDGGFPQNFWINGDSYWRGIQLDEVAFPVLLAWRLHEQGALREFDPYPMVMRAAAYLIHNGPATEQERWEEASGDSPSTLAASIAALVVAACFARERGEALSAEYLEDYADFLEEHVEPWTVTTDGTLHPEVKRHYIRIRPRDVRDTAADEDPNRGWLPIPNRRPDSRRVFPAKEIVDAGFLELVRYGVRRADDPLVTDSLRVVDAALRVETPYGPCWRRYNHDGYGQRDDGSSYAGWGRGRAWPLLTGERGHYELAAGHEVEPFIRAMEGFASSTGMLPEQVWDAADRPGAFMHLGRPTGSAMPLMWAHAEYIKLLRSAADGAVFDRVPPVAERYLTARKASKHLEIWKGNRRVRAVRRGGVLRIQSAAPFRLRFTRDEWRTTQDAASTPTALGIEYVDVGVSREQQAPIRFTLPGTSGDQGDGAEHAVMVVE